MDRKRLEIAAAWALIAAAFALRIYYALHLRIDKDEPLHLHVVWGWANGLVQYRDVFDNHTPLFHMLMAPLFALIGERADTFILMRLAMVPLAALAAWLVWLIGRDVFTPRVGLWAAAVSTLIPPFFRPSVEFRADVLWTVLWLAALAVMVRPPMTLRRAFASGLLLGCCAATSLKTTFLLLGLILAVAGALILTARRFPAGAGFGRLTKLASASAAGLLVVPAAFLALFAGFGALGPLVYGTITHNMVSAEWHVKWLPMAGVAAVAAAGVLVLRPSLAAGPSGGATARRAFVLLLPAGLLAAACLWPVRCTYSFMPVHAAGAVLVVVGIGGLRGIFRRSPGDACADMRVWPVAALAVFMAAWLVVFAPRTSNIAQSRQSWDEVLRLTAPGETVHDEMGELLFRPRAFYYILETFTLKRIDCGMLADTVADRVVAAHAYVATVSEERTPRPSAAFLRENFIRVGEVRVAGKFLGAAPARFDVLVPAEYSVVTPSGRGRGTLDGKPCPERIELACGPHEYVPAPGEKDAAIVWTRAVERGFTPFLSAGGRR